MGKRNTKSEGTSRKVKKEKTQKKSEGETQVPKAKVTIRLWRACFILIQCLLVLTVFSAHGSQILDLMAASYMAVMEWLA